MQPDFPLRVAKLLGLPEQYRPHNAYGGRVDWSTDQLAEAAGKCVPEGYFADGDEEETAVTIGMPQGKCYRGVGPTLRAALIAALTAYFAAVPENANG